MNKKAFILLPAMMMILASCGGNTASDSGSNGGKTTSGGGDSGQTTGTWEILTSAPTVGTTYRAGLYRTADDKTVYLTGNNYKTYEWYQEYSDDESKAATVTVEKNGDGFNIKVGSKYFVIESGEKVSNYYRDTPSSTPWIWDGDYNTFSFNVDGTNYYSGSSEKYTSVSASQYTYISYSNSYPLHLYVQK